MQCLHSMLALASVACLQDCQGLTLLRLRVCRRVDVVKCARRLVCFVSPLKPSHRARTRSACAFHRVPFAFFIHAPYVLSTPSE